MGKTDLAHARASGQKLERRRPGGGGAGSVTRPQGQKEP